MGNPGAMAQALVFPQVVAHRGASAVAAEHTAEAYQSAIDSGAEALECDVRLTADGHLVLVHDPRIDRTSTGRGRVSNQTLEQLQEHNFGSWWDPQNPGEGEILTLDDLLELTTGADRPIDLAIETKHPTRYGGYTEQVLVRTLERHGLSDGKGVRVMSFAAIALRRMRELAPQVPTVYLMDKVPMLQRVGQLPFGAQIAGPSIDVLRSEPVMVRRWRSDGYRIHVWTVDTAEDVRFCMSERVDAIITNHPREVLIWRDEVWRELQS